MATFRRRHATLGLIVVAASLAYLWLREPMSEEDRVRAAIFQVAAGSREADLGATLEPVSSRYQDGELDRTTLAALLYGEFRKHGRITTLFGPVEIRIEGETAEAEFDCALASGIDLAALDAVPDQAESFHFRASLAKEDGDWKIVGSEHERAEPFDVTPRRE